MTTDASTPEPYITVERRPAALAQTAARAAEVVPG